MLTSVAALLLLEIAFVELHKLDKIRYMMGPRVWMQQHEHSTQLQIMSSSV